MKKNYLILLTLLTVNSYAISQIKVTKADGGSVTTNLSAGIKVNGKSTLKREWIILNDQNCPVQLIEVGVNTDYSSRGFVLMPFGEISMKEPIAAFEIHHVLYDIFGAYIITLNNTEVADITSNQSLQRMSNGWSASENRVSKYFRSVSYVAKVRTMNGTIWQYNPLEVKTALKNSEVAYEEGYAPSNKDQN